MVVVSAAMSAAHTLRRASAGNENLAGWVAPRSSVTSASEYKTFPQELQRSKDSHSQRIHHEIPCGQGLYEPWEVGCDFGGKYCLLAEAKMLVMLYLHGEEFQVLCYIGWCP